MSLNRCLLLLLLLLLQDPAKLQELVSTVSSLASDNAQHGAAHPRGQPGRHSQQQQVARDNTCMWMGQRCC